MINLIDRTKSLRTGKVFNRAWYGRIYQIVRKIADFSSLTVSVVLVDDQEMRVLNQRYRKIDKTTDVLSFRYNYQEVFGQKNGGEGEIFICHNQAEKQSKRSRVSILKEVSTLFVHGLLHLYGFDHVKVKDRLAMFKLQKKIISFLCQQKIC